MSEDNEQVLADRCHWSFDAVADRFEGHIEKSVPNYTAGHELVCRYIDFVLRDDSLIYEVGCSSGAFSRRFLAWNDGRPAVRYIGIDSAPRMVDVARERSGDDSRPLYVCDDITKYSFEVCTAVVSYYTMQFVHPAYRQEVFNSIYRSLEWGGMFILFEKVRGPDARFQDYASQVYNDIKQVNGFSDQEIMNKAQSLKGVLEPFSSEGNLGLLRRAGFSDIASIYKWVCFEGWVAIK